MPKPENPHVPNEPGRSADNPLFGKSPTDTYSLLRQAAAFTLLGEEVTGYFRTPNSGITFRVIQREGRFGVYPVGALTEFSAMQAQDLSRVYSAYLNNQLNHNPKISLSPDSKLFGKKQRKDKGK